MFGDYLILGFEHILDLNGYDHILFVTVLCALYTPAEWKKVLFLVTAFTIGHSLTLALSSLDMIAVNSQWIERAIPITIILTGITNIYSARNNAGMQEKQQIVPLQYVITTVFGLIHGMGFSNYFKAILGKEASIFQPLLAFNLGVELGQLIIVSLFLTFTFVVINLGNVRRSYWTIPVSALSALVAVYLLLQR
jgi:hypothetical protein